METSHSAPETPEGSESVSPARLPLWMLISGILPFLGTLILFCRLTWEQTFLTWELGPQMVGFALAHGTGALLFVFPILLLVWAVSVLIANLWNVFRKRQISKWRWIALSAAVALFIFGSLPEGFWQRAFIARMAASAHSSDLILYAAYRGDLGTVRGLITHGVPVDAKSRGVWRTALHGAAVRGDIDMIRFLASSGANVNAVDRSGDSPVELAVENHRDKAAEVLGTLGGKKIQGSQAQHEKAIDDQIREDIDPERR